MRRKSQKVKAAEKRKAFVSKKKLKGNIPLDADKSGSDIDSDSFYQDEIDVYHKNQDDEMSTDDEELQKQESSSEEEEVLPISGDEDEEYDDKDDYGADGEDEDSEENDGNDLPNPEAWGKRKSVYYSADFVDEDRGRTYREEDAKAARAEAEEALAIQKGVLSQVSAEKLGIDVLLDSQSESSEDEEQDLIHATVQEKLKFLKKTSPELFKCIEDFENNCKEVRERILPLLHLASKGKLPSEACTYVKLKYQLILHCNLNISMYMMLRNKCSVDSNHPVIQRITSFKNLLEKLRPIDDAVKKDVDYILLRLQENDEDISFDVPTEYRPIKQIKRPLKNCAETEPPPKKKKKVDFQFETEAEKEILSFINEVKEKQKKAEAKILENIETPEDNKPEAMNVEKRTITSEIAKNRGLTPYRKKEHRNPRVHNRMKYRKAKIRRKGQVRNVIREVKRYEGEPTGISAHVVKSIKLK